MENYLLIDKQKIYAVNHVKYLSNKNKNYLKIYTILFYIFINIFCLYKLKLKNYQNYRYIYKKEYQKNREEVINNSSLYNLIKYPQISILIINISNWNISDTELLYLLTSLRNQSLLEIQIIFSFDKSINKNQIDILKKYSQNDKRIEIFELKSSYIYQEFNDLLNILKGKFILILDKLLSFEEMELESYYNFTKGKINNIYKFSTKYQNIHYLIKTKILKDLIDKGIELKNYNELINYITKLKEPKINTVSIALCPNNYYTGLAYVCMISILSSKDIFSYISFYIIIPKDYTQKNIDFLLSLYDQYDYFNITFLKMDNRYEKSFTSRYITCQAYYRFSLGELLPNLNRIIYLDSDTIVLSDLNNFYNLNFNGRIILGQVTGHNKTNNKDIYNINSGVLLLNLNQMRKIKVEKNVLMILKSGFKGKYHDQTLLNTYFNNYTGIFPPKYQARSIINYEDIIKYNKRNSGNLYNNDYFYFSWKYPTIRHYLGHNKPMEKKNVINIEDWWYFARQSKYFQKKSFNLTEIFNFKYK